MYKHLWANAQFLCQTLNACANKHALAVLRHYYARNRNTFLPLIVMPGYQFLLMKLWLKLYFLLHLDHVFQNSQSRINPRISSIDIPSLFILYDTTSFQRGVTP